MENEKQAPPPMTPEELEAHKLGGLKAEETAPGAKTEVLPGQEQQGSLDNEGGEGGAE